MLDLTINRQSFDPIVKQTVMDANCIKFVEVLFANYYAVIEREFINNPNAKCIVMQWTRHNYPDLVGYLSTLWLSDINERLTAYLSDRIKGNFSVNVRKNKGAKEYFYTASFAILPEHPSGLTTQNCVAILDRRNSDNDLTIQGRLWSGGVRKDDLLYVVDVKANTVLLMRVDHIHRNKEKLEYFDIINENVYLRLSRL